MKANNLIIKGLLVLLPLLVFTGCLPEDDEATPVHTVSMTNHSTSSNSIWYVYMSLTSDSAWGDDRLGADTISVGETHNFAVANCNNYFDMKIVYYDGTERFAVDQYFACNETSYYTVYDY